MEPYNNLYLNPALRYSANQTKAAATAWREGLQFYAQKLTLVTTVEQLRENYFAAEREFYKLFAEAGFYLPAWKIPEYLQAEHNRKLNHPNVCRRNQ